MNRPHYRTEGMQCTSVTHANGTYGNLARCLPYLRGGEKDAPCRRPVPLRQSHPASSRVPLPGVVEKEKGKRNRD